ncbi:unnamed protein product [Lymnaea stagnalis]|uniref:Uncharacterized protein n=1 Tax=Lymnaea stagnalis TaxID=6523 RepID=A0AAV2HLI1_LYMST
MCFFFHLFETYSNFLPSEINTCALFIPIVIVVFFLIVLIPRGTWLRQLSWYPSTSKKEKSALDVKNSSPESNQNEDQVTPLPNKSKPARLVIPEIEECLYLDQADNMFSRPERIPNLKSKYETCTKNSGHAAFISIKDFKMSDLPDAYQKSDIYKFIKTMVDLTVLLTAKCTSSKNGGHCAVKLGTGWISSVIEHENGQMCPCIKCTQSFNPSSRWGEVIVCTSKYVFLNNDEAKTTKCTLFYNDYDSKCVTIDAYAREAVDRKSDISKLKCVTCNGDLLKQLNTILNKWNRLHKKVNRSFLDAREMKKLTCIVSHIHGQPKMISLGMWAKRCPMGHLNCYTELTKYTYSNATCPGSAGAYVYLQCRDNRGWLYEHFHCGVDADGNNCSGTGKDYSYKENVKGDSHLRRRV